MKPNFEYNPDITAYVDFFERFKTRNQGRKISSVDKNFPIAKKLPGLFSFLSSFSSIALYNDKLKNPIAEWNPLSQRVFYKNRKRFKSPNLVSNFDEAMDVMERFVELTHEAMHVLLWEPFFVGKIKNISKKKFVQDSLYFEGFCFWYADIIVTRKLRETFNNGEFIIPRRAVSQHNFHPYRAFELMGIKNPKKILDIYMDAFNGERTAIFTHQKKNFVRDLFIRFAEFYLGNLSTVILLKEQLEDIGVFGEFQKKFCLKGLPTLFPEKIFSIKDTKAYCHAVFEYGLNHVQRLDHANILRVRMRRSIQLRAYTAYSLIHLIKQKKLTSVTQNKIKYDTLFKQIEFYISNLEQCIKDLKNNLSLSIIEKNLNQNDQMYNKKIRSSFSNKQVWVAERKMIFPMIKKPIRVLEKNSNLSPEHMDILNRHMMTMCMQNSLNLPTFIKSNKNFFKKISRFTKVLSNKRMKNKNVWRQAYNALLMDENILPWWSVPLESIDPSTNSFRETTFVYK